MAPAQTSPTPPALNVGPDLVRLPPALVFRYLTLGLLAGFITGYWLVIPLPATLTALAVVLLAMMLKLSPFQLGIFILGFLLALTRGNGLIPPPVEEDFLGSQTFVAQVIEIPRPSQRVTRYVSETIDSHGRVLLVASPWPEFSYGDVIEVTCKKVEAVDFTPYTNRGLWRQCAWPELKLVSSAKKDIRAWLFKARKFSGDKIRALTPEPYATLATGMLWGDDAGLPSALVESFRRTGTSHLLAVSGFNVMVLSKVMFWLFIALGLWRRQASVAVLVLIAMFVVFSGAEPSVVRAGAMGSLLLLGQMVARKPDDFNILLGTAAVMLLISPRLIVELGWQLSFAAMAGLTYLSPLLRPKLNFLPEVLGLKQSAAETLAATLVTMPVILVRLGQLSPLTPLANLMIAPVVVTVYWFGLSLLILNLISATVAWPAVWLLSGVLFYMTTVITWLASLPWAYLPTGVLVWLAVVIFYLLVAVWLAPKEFFKHWRRLRKREV